MRHQRWLAGLAAAAMGVIVLAGCGSTNATGNSNASKSSSSGGGFPTGSVTLLETGSTLLYPLFQEWAPAYHQIHPNVTITPAGTGSGTGISDAEANSVQIGASDAYMSNPEIGAYPGILNIPLAISAQIIAYNIPGHNNTHLNINGAILAGIYTGSITNWDNSAIKAANPNVTLPNLAIVPIRRADSSGDSFLFTSYMSDTDATVWTGGYSTSPNWPSVAKEVSATGNGGMVQALKSTKGGIAYVGISYENQIVSASLGYAMLENAASNYVLPTASNIESAVNTQYTSTPPDERVSLIDGPGSNSYPIINYEYAVIQTQQSNAATATVLKNFLDWASNPKDGSAAKYLNPVHFQALPASIQKLSKAQIAKIHG